MTAPFEAWKAAYAAMHRDGAAAFPPACLHYVLETVRAACGSDADPRSPADVTAAFRDAARRDFGPLARDVLADWGLTTPGDLGRAVALLGDYGCLSLGDDERADAFAADDAPLTIGDDA